jgi:hypothetical protein
MFGRMPATDLRHRLDQLLNLEASLPRLQPGQRDTSSIVAAP